MSTSSSSESLGCVQNCKALEDKIGACMNDLAKREEEQQCLSEENCQLHGIVADLSQQNAQWQLKVRH